ncbi:MULTISPECIES: formate dehydrogenase accessory sulfurtransferase FdhD [Stenotrophomonas]|uniref:formate dehydrogenase accessory sulfurtransferase FdhD n=1 Tax=Stenotrophomonas TaxID=40323 RepID=UPI00201CC8F3|nr:MULTISPECIES: formate dehydrogenase accessory sulfurtransferase FdhD [Stenotrophomonas]MBN5024342.1 formate dehydrogenase accessory sulfurtransferase FdhD [Stenotrophomonas maltophilia]MDH1272236.1 formate dehydrogenase accessory sulfurtransferase FdhD [Stenotrophomonas sp. GD03937]MDH1483454.1 formate dehydrogenase accessory sulfurtransferase FdhD [Stenotrophomonas sp. GD03712]UQY96529.1 formate dehydrogenase accessory sulfurtransferase FdhD [Stenotrophomonas maltophilia]WON66834.1 formate
MPDPTPPHTPPAGTAQRPLHRWRGGLPQLQLDVVAEEVPVAMRYNGAAFSVMMATPCDLEDFALGFSLSEGLITAPAQLLAVEVRPQLEGIELQMTVAADAPGAALDPDEERLLPGRGGCGLCGTRQLEDVLRPLPPIRERRTYAPAALQRALAELAQHQPMNAASGAIHAAAWADASGRIGWVREDVGRHNALDKLIGALHHNEHAIDGGLLVISSRASYEMVSKAVRAGASVLAAVSAPTALAIDLARSAGLCLIGFARESGFNVYTHPERLQADEPSR